jgi:uncharacterized membrane protein YqjE
MNFVLIPIAGLMLIILVFILNSIPPKKNRLELVLKALIILLFIAGFIVIWHYTPVQRFE